MFFINQSLLLKTGMVDLFIMQIKETINSLCLYLTNTNLAYFLVHYIILNIYKENELVMTKESKTQSGYSPVWNQPFLFDIPGSSVADYSLELVIMRGRLYSKDGVIGRVVVGRHGPKTGVDHWHEMIKPCAREVAKWHYILPVFKFE